MVLCLSLSGAWSAETQSDAEADALFDSFNQRYQDANAVYDDGRYGEAARLFERLLADMIKEYGEADVATAEVGIRLAFMYYSQFRLLEADAYASVALRVLVEQLPSLDIRLASAYLTIGTIKLELGRLEEAEQYHRRAIVVAEAVDDRQFLSSALLGLAAGFRMQGRAEEAFNVQKRALEITKSLFGDNAPELRVPYNNLAQAAAALNRAEDALNFSAKSLEVAEATLRPDHPGLVLALSNHSIMLSDAGRAAEAEPFARRALEASERELPEGHPDLARMYAVMGRILFSLERAGEAVEFLQTALAMQERVLPRGHEEIEQTMSTLARSLTDAGRYEEALSYLDLLTEIRTAASNDNEYVAYSWRMQADQRLKIAERLIERDGRQSVDLIRSTRRKAFEDFQRDRASATGAALTAAAARLSSTKPEANRLIRQRDQLLEKIQQLNEAFGLLARDDSMDRDARALQMAAIQAEVESTEFRIDSLNVALDRLFPEYAELSAALPLGVEELQALLEPDEVLISINPIDSDGHVFAYWKDGGYASEFYHFEDGDMPVDDLARYIRCTAAFAIDAGCRDNPMGEHRQSAESGGGAASTGTRGADAIDDSPDSVDFDIVAAHYLYYRLFPPDLRPLVAGKKLIIAPAPELLGIPWHLLVTEMPPKGWNEPNVDLRELYRATAWLFRQHPSITVIPTIASLKALRSSGDANGPVRSYLGIADPVIGRNDAERMAPAADCGDVGPVASADGGLPQADARAAAAPAMLFTKATERQRADVDLIRLQPRLPDTRCEVGSVADALQINGAKTRNLAGADATETTIKVMSENGELAGYDILHFATHGIVGGQLRAGRSGLILTPPARASDLDDGVLTVDEIAALRMSAKWVILSACNTAAGDEVNGEALTGLARSFFYAGAKSMLVSSWPVYSRAASELTTRTFAALSANPGLSRGEALNLAMEETLQQAATSFEAHPRYWAPFYMIGEAR